jgi:hypothetical protein
MRSACLHPRAFHRDSSISPNDRKSQLVDVNNDGWLDLVTSTSISDGLPRYLGHPRIYINKGQVGGVWQGFRYEYARIPQLLSTTGAIANPRFCSVVAGDLTGDGYVDLYFSDYDTGQVGPAENPNNDMDNKLLINQGAANPGYFVDESVLRMGPRTTTMAPSRTCSGRPSAWRPSSPT